MYDALFCHDVSLVAGSHPIYLQIWSGITRDTLRRRAEAYDISKYSRGVTRRVYYRKVDLDKLNRPRPVDKENA